MQPNYPIDDDVTVIARTGEPERYLAALLAPEPFRTDLLAIAAFVAELARIPAVVKEPMMGEIRLQWWRDAIGGEDNPPAAPLASPPPKGGGGLSAPASAEQAATGNPVVDAIVAAVRRHALPLPLLLAMTEARAFDLYGDPMPDEAAYRGYLDKTVGAPFVLALQLLGTEVPPSLADHAGRAFGASRLLATLPAWLARGRVPLPLTWLAETGLTADDLLAGTDTPATLRLIDRVLTEITADHAAARHLARSLPRRSRTALLPLATIPPYLRAIRARGRNPLRSIAEITPLARITRIARAHWLGL